jgi:phage-related minor tail protein
VRAALSGPETKLRANRQRLLTGGESKLTGKLLAVEKSQRQNELQEKTGLDQNSENTEVGRPFMKMSVN